MLHKSKLKILFGCVPVILAIIFMSGCAAKTVEPWGDPQTGVMLQYRLPMDEALMYESTGDVTQTIDVMGQTIDTEINSSSKYSFTSKGLRDGNLVLGVKIGDMEINVASVQGDFTPDMSTVIGKGFDMILSPMGKELDVSGAKELEYETASGKQSLSSGFQAIFPNLPDKPLKIGDTWPTEDTIVDSSTSTEVTIKLENLNTVDGFEVVDGMECVRIKTTGTGTFTGEGTEGGADLVFNADIKSTDIWYFAYKKGVFVKMESEAFAEGTITVTSPQNMEIPLARDMKTSIWLVK